MDGNGFPVFTDSNPSNLYSRVTQAADEVNSLVTGVSAGEFNDHTAYAKNTYVTHKANGVTKLYQFTSAHASGPWTGTDVVEVTGLFTKVSQNSEAITLKVSKGDVATQLSVECGNVTITGGDLVVSGMITSSDLAAGNIYIGNVQIGTYLEVGYPNVAMTVDSSGNIAGESLSVSSGISGGSLTIEGSTTDAEITNAKALGLVYGLTLTPPASGSSTYTLSWTTVDGTQHSETFSRAASVRTVRTLTPTGGSVNVGSKVYTVNANIVYTDNDTGVSDIQIPLVVGSYDSANTAYPVTVAGISGILISATGAYNSGYTAGETAMLSLYDVISADKLTSGTITASGSNVTIPLSIVIGDDLADPPVTKTNNSKSVTTSIAGVLETATATLTTTAHQMTPSSGKVGFASVTIPAINLQDDTFSSNGQYLVPANKDGYGTINVSVSGAVTSSTVRGISQSAYNSSTATEILVSGTPGSGYYTLHIGTATGETRDVKFKTV